jgi:hypothetical protein
MKGISRISDYIRDLVVAANQDRPLLNPPWMQTVNQSRWFRYNLQVGAFAPTRVATRDIPLVPDRDGGFLYY